MPDLDLVTRDGPVRVFELLHEARPLLINLGAPGALVTDRVRVIDATYDGEWELPVLGRVSAPSGLLVRPDGYVAWVGAGTSAGLDEAVGSWC
jgi:3-(3-hydroxy-phenyl)propionate hydroxylase